MGYDLRLEQIKQFRQRGSRTPGHPERGLTPDVMNKLKEKWSQTLGAPQIERIGG